MMTDSEILPAPVEDELQEVEELLQRDNEYYVESSDIEDIDTEEEDRDTQGLMDSVFGFDSDNDDL